MNSSELLLLLGEGEVLIGARAFTFLFLDWILISYPSFTLWAMFKLSLNFFYFETSPLFNDYSFCLSFDYSNPLFSFSSAFYGLFSFAPKSIWDIYDASDSFFSLFSASAVFIIWSSLYLSSFFEGLPSALFWKPYLSFWPFWVDLSLTFILILLHSSDSCSSIMTALLSDCSFISFVIF